MAHPQKILALWRFGGSISGAEIEGAVGSTRLTTDDPTIRAARPDDYSSFARLFPELAVDDPTPSRERWLAELAATTLIAERAQQPVGYAYFQLLDGIGYVRNVVSAPEARRTGVGAALMLAIADHLRKKGAKAWCLNVKPRNLPAVRLYEKLGMKRIHASVALQISWQDVAALPPAPADAHHASIAADDDGALEAALKLPGGLLAQLRSQGRVLLKLERSVSREPLGLAAFDPQFPGAFPFRLTHAEYAPALLCPLREHALPEHDFLRLVIEDDAALVAALKAAGATVHLEFVHYRGPL
jgi:ribosomal protein S18 acetylase RimI-like enzyme